MLAGYKGVRGKKDVKLDGLPGIEITHDHEAKGLKVVIVERIAITRDRAFQLMAIAAQGKTAESAKFFDSFRLLEPPAKKDR